MEVGMEVEVVMEMRMAMMGMVMEVLIEVRVVVEVRMEMVMEMVKDIWTFGAILSRTHRNVLTHICAQSAFNHWPLLRLWLQLCQDI